MTYHLDLEGFSLESFAHILQTEPLLPSQKVLKEDVEARFAILASRGLYNLKDLLTALSTKKKIEQFAQRSGLSPAYLTILRRRAGIYTPDPVALDKFPGFAPEHIQSLAALGIKDSRQLFERACSLPSRAELSAAAHVPEDVLLELVKLCDLVRAPYVGAVWARLFYEAGADTLEKLAASQPEQLHANLQAANDRCHLTKSSIPSVQDLTASLAIYRLIPFLAEY
ncbi:MAG TPA: DUF4332 domain-containing protein [Aggregatilineaceae bacterium]|nr:DUF4332 domain-containing protein [Aggregatilineaceae bacterium]